MGLIDAIRGALSREPGAEEKGRIFAQEAAKIDNYNIKPESLHEVIEAEGLENQWSDFMDGVVQEQHRLATLSGRVYCSECGNYYLPPSRIVDIVSGSVAVITHRKGH